ncbi:type III PLP-dependent enzyme [Nocardia gipuzkoensis]|uniref:type III PLP-dependent enzyme n=1 Tax=Nocardia gipuzkoensis TaxID=2749991 RepID=UPI0015EEABC6|nr:type III PLP-dependent enzyme [Nocardia gipuzkoensis]
MSVLTAAVADRARTLRATELPAYIYDLAALRDHAAFIRAALPDRVELYYAAKANPEPEILATLAGFVDGFEVSSGGELAHVAAAVPQRPLAFGGPGKTPEELSAALEHDVHRIHVESVSELRTLAALVAARRPERPVGVMLRVNLPISIGALEGSSLAMGGRATPFGLDQRHADALAGELAAGRHPGLHWHGVHAHLASGLDATDLLETAASIVQRAIDLAERHGVALAEVNVGGGMNVDYTAPDQRFDWETYGTGLAGIIDAWPDLRLRIEPGRALSAYSGWYVTDVLDVKPSYETEFAVVRGGTHHLRTPAAKGHDQPCAILPIDDWPHPWPRATATSSAVTVTGQLCTPKDTLAQRIPAPGLRAGDRIAFALAGAYAWNISHHDFLMHPAPSFHFLNADSPSPEITC